MRYSPRRRIFLNTWKARNEPANVLIEAADQNLQIFRTTQVQD